MADDDRLAHQIMEIVPLVMRALAADLRRSVQLMNDSHFRLLWILRHHSCSLSELAELHAVSLPTMSNSITALEERGWAARVRAPEDRRRVVVSITPAGKLVLDEARAHTRSYVASMLDTLTANERDRLAEGLDILNQIFGRAAPELCEHTTGRDASDR